MKLWPWRKKAEPLIDNAAYFAKDGKLFRLCDGVISEFNPPIAEVREVRT